MSAPGRTPYQWWTQGISLWIRSHSAFAAGNTLRPVTAAYRSSWFPLAPHLKHWNALVCRFAENDRLRFEADRWIGHGPRTCWPHEVLGTNPSNSRTSAKEISARTWRKQIPGIGEVRCGVAQQPGTLPSPHNSGTEKRNPYSAYARRPVRDRWVRMGWKRRVQLQNRSCPRATRTSLLNQKRRLSASPKRRRTSQREDSTKKQICRNNPATCRSPVQGRWPPAATDRRVHAARSLDTAGQLKSQSISSGRLR